MGWLNALVLGDVGNQLDIGALEREVLGLRHGVRRAMDERDARHLDTEGRLAWLERENGELKLTVVTLLRLMASKGQIDLRELQALAKVVDAEDGVVDGQARPGR